MSYDISVWNVPRVLSQAEIEMISKVIHTDGDCSNLLATDSKINEFVENLESIYPQIDSSSDGGIDLCPWSSEFELSGGHVDLSFVWSKAREISSFVFDLAMKHGLAVFDFKTKLLYVPDSLAPRSEFMMSSPWLMKDQLAYTQIIPDLISALQKRNDPYLVVDGGKEKYIQTLWTKNGFILEYRDGCADRHFRATTYLQAETVSQAIIRYIDAKHWKDGIEFHKVEIKN